MCAIFTTCNRTSLKPYNHWLFLCIGLLFAFPAQLDATKSTAWRFNTSSDLIVMAVEREYVCAEFGEIVELVCNLTSTASRNSTDLTAWGLSWRFTNIIRDSNMTILHHSPSLVSIRLRVKFNWSDIRQFICFASPSYLTKPSVVNISKSVSLLAKPLLPIGTAGIRGQFSETKQGQAFEVFWHLTAVDSVSTLTYCIRDDYDDLEMDSVLGGRVCPRFVKVKSGCILKTNTDTQAKGRVVYECKGVIQYGRSAPTAMEHRVLVRVERKGFPQCAMENMAAFTLQIIPVYVPSSGITSLLLKPYPVTNLKIELSISPSGNHALVLITWSDPGFVSRTSNAGRDYDLKVNCSGNPPIWSEFSTRGEKNISLRAPDFRPAYRPYAFCRFCVRARIADGGLFSEAECRWVRLPEGKPGSAPRITCSGDECEAVSDDDDDRRNVTVTWTMPPREAWNGVLVELRVAYSREGNWSEMRLKMVRNITQNMTKGSTVLKDLDTRSNYVVRMKACTVVGCSRPGNETWISAAQVTTSHSDDGFSEPRLGESWSKIMITVLVVVFLFLLTSFVAIVVWCRRHDRAAKRSEDLPSLSEPDAYESPIMAESVTTLYTELNVSCDVSDVGSAQSVNSNQDCSLQTAC